MIRSRSRPHRAVPCASPPKPDRRPRRTTPSRIGAARSCARARPRSRPMLRFRRREGDAPEIGRARPTRSSKTSRGTAASNSSPRPAPTRDRPVALAERLERLHGRVAVLAPRLQPGQSRANATNFLPLGPRSRARTACLTIRPRLPRSARLGDGPPQQPAPPTGADQERMTRGDGWWPGAESNCRPQVFQTCALPTELPGRCSVAGTTGFEPATSGLTGRRELQASPRPRGPEVSHLGHPLRLRGLGEYRRAVPGFTVGLGGRPFPFGHPRRAWREHRGDGRRGRRRRLARSPGVTHHLSHLGEVGMVEHGRPDDLELLVEEDG